MKQKWEKRRRRNIFHASSGKSKYEKIFFIKHFSSIFYTFSCFYVWWCSKFSIFFILSNKNTEKARTQIKQYRLSHTLMSKALYPASCFFPFFLFNFHFFTTHGQKWTEKIAELKKKSNSNGKNRKVVNWENWKIVCGNLRRKNFTRFFPNIFIFHFQKIERWFYICSCAKKINENKIKIVLYCNRK